MIRPKQVVSATFTVFAFWMTILLVSQYDLVDWKAFLLREKLVLIGAGVGLVCAVLYIYTMRNLRLSDLDGKPVRGMDSSIGEIPIHRKTLRRAKTAPDLTRFMPQEAKTAHETDFIDVWKKTWEKTHPAYVRLMDALVATFTAPGTVNLPATHATDPRHNHGGRSLITHSLLVSWLMYREAAQWTYVPAVSAGKSLQKRDPNYVFNPNDPMHALIGFAHDIGKIECFVVENGKVIECRKNHDLVGAQILARMDEYWDSGISTEDREILQLVVAHYHHPSEIPFAADGKVISDKMHAILEFLIKCDRLASAIENGSNYKDAINDAKNLQIFDENEEGQMDLWDAMLDVLSRGGRINDENQKTNVGWIYRMPHYQNKRLLVLKEDNYIAQVAQVSGRTDLLEQRTKGANGVSTLTRQCLTLLGDKHARALFTDHEASPRAPESSLFAVSFYDPKTYFADKDRTIPRTVVKTSPSDTHVPYVIGEDRRMDTAREVSASRYDKTHNTSGWRAYMASCILIDVDANPDILNALTGVLGSDWRSVPHILNSRMGRQGVKGGGREPSELAARRQSDPMNIVGLVNQPKQPTLTRNNGVLVYDVLEAHALAGGDNIFTRDNKTFLIEKADQVLKKAGLPWVTLDAIASADDDVRAAMGITDWRGQGESGQESITLGFRIHAEGFVTTAQAMSTTASNDTPSDEEAVVTVISNEDVDGESDGDELLPDVYESIDDDDSGNAETEQEIPVAPV